jgi:hypothetical protein
MVYDATEPAFGWHFTNDSRNDRALAKVIDKLIQVGWVPHWIDKLREYGDTVTEILRRVLPDDRRVKGPVSKYIFFHCAFALLRLRKQLEPPIWRPNQVFYSAGQPNGTGLIFAITCSASISQLVTTNQNVLSNCPMTLPRRLP